MNEIHMKKECPFSSLACFAPPSVEIAQFCEGSFAFTRFVSEESERFISCHAAVIISPPLPNHVSEESERFISCHPELAKDLTTHRAALCYRSSSSKLTAPNTTPSAPKNAKGRSTLVRPREIPSTDSGQALRKLPMNLPVADRRSAPTARPHTSLGQRPTAIKISLEALVTRARSRSRSQSLIGNALVFESLIREPSTTHRRTRSNEGFPGTESFAGRSADPSFNAARIGDSQTMAFPIWRLGTSALFLNLMAVGQRPRSLGHNGLALKARFIPPEIWNALSALNALFFEILGRCPRLVWGWAVGPEMRQAMPGSCPTINAALWPPASLRMTAYWVPFFLGRPAGRIWFWLCRAESLARIHSSFP